METYHNFDNYIILYNWQLDLTKLISFETSGNLVVTMTLVPMVGTVAEQTAAAAPHQFRHPTQRPAHSPRRRDLDKPPARLEAPAGLHSWPGILDTTSVSQPAIFGCLTIR